jgi:arsenite methyltransferase
MSGDAAFWDAIAEKYSRQPVANPEAFERKIAITKSLIQPQDVVLDIGCGTGSLALRLAPCAASVHGLDISGEMIRIARGKAEAQQVANVQFHVGALDDGFVQFEPGSLDMVCAYSLLRLVEDLPGF